MNSKKKQRIILLDTLRIFAIVMMVQGHTIHSLLDISYSNSPHFIYQAWIFFRGITAPIFIFSAGLIFTYLLLENQFSFKNNPRIKKGIFRGITLILIGYLLRYPTINIFKLNKSTYEQWLIFFSVDVLHLIGVGLLLILTIAYITDFFKIELSLLFLSLSLFFLIATPFVNSIEWNITLIPIASYFTNKFGSIFPLFPYLLYVFLGSFFGVLVARDKSLIAKLPFLLIIFGFGIAIMLFIQFLSNNFGLNLYYNSLLKIGMVLILFSTMGLLVKNINSIPNYLQSLAKNSLWIYIIHLVILYGSPTSIGLHQIVGKILSAEITIVIAISMIFLMIIISLGIDKLRDTKFNIF